MSEKRDVRRFDVQIEGESGYKSAVIAEVLGGRLHRYYFNLFAKPTHKTPRFKGGYAKELDNGTFTCQFSLKQDKKGYLDIPTTCRLRPETEEGMKFLLGTMEKGDFGNQRQPEPEMEIVASPTQMPHEESEYQPIKVDSAIGLHTSLAQSQEVEEEGVEASAADEEKENTRESEVSKKKVKGSNQQRATKALIENPEQKVPEAIADPPSISDNELEKDARTKAVIAMDEQLRPLLTDPKKAPVCDQTLNFYRRVRQIINALKLQANGQKGECRIEDQWKALVAHAKDMLAMREYFMMKFSAACGQFDAVGQGFVPRLVDKIWADVSSLIPRQFHNLVEEEFCAKLSQAFKKVKDKKSFLVTFGTPDPAINVDKVLFT